MAGSYGRFIPQFPEKYVGDSNSIMFRSRWELDVMKWMDQRQQVLKWGSEELKIAYLSPADNRVHNYIPDFFMLVQEKDGTLKKWLVEVKPRHEADEKYAKHDRSKAALEVNNAKWKAAKIFCDQNGLEFIVLTEKSIYHQGVKGAKK